MTLDGIFQDERNFAGREREGIIRQRESHVQRHESLRAHTKFKQRLETWGMGSWWEPGALGPRGLRVPGVKPSADCGREVRPATLPLISLSAEASGDPESRKRKAALILGLSSHSREDGMIST